MSFRLNGRKSSEPGIIFLLLISIFLNSNLNAQTDTRDFEEVSVLFQVENYGNFYVSSLYSPEGKLFISVEELFRNLKIPFSPLSGKQGIEGFIGDEENKYSIEYESGKIFFRKNNYNTDSSLVSLTGSIYLESSFFGNIFGIHLTFNFRSLSVTVKPDFELPAIKEMRLEEARMRINRNRGISLPADTNIGRTYHAFRSGMVDWYLMSNQVWGYSKDIQAGIGFGAEILGGEADIYLNYSNKYKFDKRMQNYFWRWVDNDKKLVKQVRVGKIVPQSISSVYYPVVGASVSNTPTTTRRALGEYIIKDYTEPDWDVELYINNELFDYTRADASGMFVFNVPLVYGFTTITLRFYGPMGEERSDTKTINIPYNFMPAGEFEYNINAGFLQDGNSTPFGRVETAYGVTRNFTLSAGFEYLSSIQDKPEIPFVKASFLPFGKLIITGEYDHGVRYRGTLNYYPFSSTLIELDYIRYNKDQKAILFNYLEEKKVSLSIPVKAGSIAGFARLGYKQNVYENFNYNIAELSLSGYYKSFNTNISTYANWINGNTLYVNSTAALSWRLKHGITIRTTAQFNLSKGKLLLYKEEIEKRFLKAGYFSVFFEDNLAINSRSLNFSLKYDLNFAQATTSARVSKKEISTYQGVRGSLMFGKDPGIIQANASSNVGRGGLTFIPFLDINHNGLKDNNERRIENLNVKINGGYIRFIERDTVISVSGLEPFISYEVVLSDGDFDNIAWRILKKRYEIMIDPNQFKIIEVPVAPVGEVNGMVMLAADSAAKGLGRVIVRIYDIQGSLITETLSEQDGYWSFLGLVPGEYYAVTDSLQMSRLNTDPATGRQYFTIRSDEYGDIADDINFILKYNESEVNENRPDRSSWPEVPEYRSNGEDYGPSVDCFNEAAADDGSISIETGRVTRRSLFYIQAGAFRNVDSGKQYGRKLNKIIPLASALVKEEDLNKLRIGYFRKRSDAKDVIKVLSENKITSYIGRGTAFVYEGDLDLAGGEHFVQTGAFRNEDYARAYYKIISLLTEYPSGIIIEDGYYKVRLGYFKTAAEAISVNHTIRNSGLESFRGDGDYYAE